MMEQWEYLTTFLEADTKDKQVKQFVEQTFNKKAKRHAPESMIPALNKLGTDGWELVHMEPVPEVGNKQDIQFDPYNWTSTYFCVFKRTIAPIESAAVVTAQSIVTDDDLKLPPIQLDPNTLPY
ncbi:MAG: hypothetical protein WBC91_08835 [Phototrophicaceae bacterium]